MFIMDYFTHIATSDRASHTKLTLVSPVITVHHRQISRHLQLLFLQGVPQLRKSWFWKILLKGS